MCQSNSAPQRQRCKHGAIAEVAEQDGNASSTRSLDGGIDLSPGHPICACVQSLVVAVHHSNISTRSDITSGSTERLQCSMAHLAIQAGVYTVISIIYTVLDSHELYRRQVQLLKSLNLDGFEIVWVDDGSDPPLQDHGLGALVATNDTRPWTNPRARNIGGSHAKGDALLFMDIDHVLDDDILNACRDKQRLRFIRRAVDLDVDGNIIEHDAMIALSPGCFLVPYDDWDKIRFDESYCGRYGMFDKVFTSRCRMRLYPTCPYRMGVISRPWSKLPTHRLSK